MAPEATNTGLNLNLKICGKNVHKQLTNMAFLKKNFYLTFLVCFFDKCLFLINFYLCISKKIIWLVHKRAIFKVPQIRQRWEVLYAKCRETKRRTNQQQPCGTFSTVLLCLFQQFSRAARSHHFLVSHNQTDADWLNHCSSAGLRAPSVRSTHFVPN